MILTPPAPLPIIGGNKGIGYKPNWHKDRTVFLAGSIEMGKASMWQTWVGDRLNSLGFTVFNPRREDWDSSWEQKVTNPEFVGQVDWELSALEIAQYVLMYYEPGTLSPISLLEFGLFHKKCVVVCPEGFWRKGNVDIVCDRYKIPQKDTLEHAIEYILGNSKEV